MSKQNSPTTSQNKMSKIKNGENFIYLRISKRDKNQLTNLHSAFILDEIYSG